MDELKQLWKRSDEQLIQLTIKKEVLESSKRRNSNSTVDKFQHNLWIEFLISLLSSVVLWAFVAHPYKIALGIGLGVFNGLMLWTIMYTSKQIQSCKQEQNTKFYLQSMIRLFELFAKRYRFIGYFLVTGGALLGVLLAPYTLYNIDSYLAIVTGAGVFLLVASAMIFATHIWVAWAYDKRIVELKQLLIELEDFEENGSRV